MNQNKNTNTRIHVYASAPWMSVRSILAVTGLLASALTSQAVVVGSGDITNTSPGNFAYSYSAVTFDNISNASTGVATIVDSSSGFNTTLAEQFGANADPAATRLIANNAGASSGQLTFKFDFSTTGYTPVALKIDHDGVAIRGSYTGTNYPVVFKTLISFDNITFSEISSRTIQKSSSSDTSFLSAPSGTDLDLVSIAASVGYTDPIDTVYYRAAYTSSGALNAGAIRWGIVSNTPESRGLQLDYTLIPEPNTSGLILGAAGLFSIFVSRRYARR